MQSKLDRLERIRTALGLSDDSSVQFHWVAISPERSSGLRPKWPRWLDWGSEEDVYHWLPLPVGHHYRAERCDDDGRANRHGTRWRLKEG